MGARWTIFEEPQMVIWPADPGGIPEVDMQYGSYELSEHPSRAKAIEWVERLMELLGGRRTEADVRPIEECGKCGRDFATSERHLCLTLIRGADHSSEEGDPEYLVRLCPACAPLLQPAVKLLDTAG